MMVYLLNNNILKIELLNMGTSDSSLWDPNNGRFIFLSYNINNTFITNIVEVESNAVIIGSSATRSYGEVTFEVISPV